MIFRSAGIFCLRQSVNPKPRFQGALDEVKIFNRALTTNEIAQSAGITYSVTYDGSGNDGGKRTDRFQ